MNPSQGAYLSATFGLITYVLHYSQKLGDTFFYGIASRFVLKKRPADQKAMLSFSVYTCLGDPTLGVPTLGVLVFQRKKKGRRTNKRCSKGIGPCTAGSSCEALLTNSFTAEFPDRPTPSCNLHRARKSVRRLLTTSIAPNDQRRQ